MKFLTLSNGTANCTLQWMNPQSFPHTCAISHNMVKLFMQTKKDLELGSNIFFGAKFCQNEKKTPKKKKLKKIYCQNILLFEKKLTTFGL
jgi:hypothetical protein